MLFMLFFLGVYLCMLAQLRSKGLSFGLQRSNGAILICLAHILEAFYGIHAKQTSQMWCEQELTCNWKAKLICKRNILRKEKCVASKGCNWGDWLPHCVCLLCALYNLVKMPFSPTRKAIILTGVRYDMRQFTSQARFCSKLRMVCTVVLERL